MNEWLLLIAASTIGSLLSLTGGFLLLSKKISERLVQRLAVPFAAGALLAAALLDLLPEALEHGESTLRIMSLVLGGFVLFFILERFLGWFHHHHEHAETIKEPSLLKRRQSTKSLIVIGDIIHNALDGLVIGTAFLADPLVGVITTIAIAAHEIPQEVGDFGVLLSLGMKKRSVVIVNILSAFATVIGAVLVYAFGSALVSFEATLLAAAAGMFIYIAASDLVPTIHEEHSARVANYQTVIFLFAIIFVGLTTTFLHAFIESKNHHENGTHQRDAEMHTENE